jgi:hypothetical protein
MRFNRKKNQIIASVICIILVLAMVIPLVMTTVF